MAPSYVRMGVSNILESFVFQLGPSFTYGEFPSITHTIFQGPDTVLSKDAEITQLQLNLTLKLRVRSIDPIPE